MREEHSIEMIAWLIVGYELIVTESGCDPEKQRRVSKYSREDGKHGEAKIGGAGGAGGAGVGGEG